MSVTAIVSVRRHRGIRTASPGARAGIITGAACLVLFAFVTFSLARHGYVQAHDPTLWNHSNPPGAGGRWIELVLVFILRLVPGSAEGALPLLTIGAGTVFLGVFTHNLVRRGWQPALAALAAGLVALHPVILTMACSGAADFLYVLMAAFVVIALDRFEAIGDTQSLILLGLLIALLSLAWPNAIFFILPLALLLPWAFKDIRSYSAATALFVIALTPALICLCAVALGGALFQQPFGDVFAVWTAPLHGAGAVIVRQSVWLAAYGGNPFRAFLVLALFCIGFSPVLLVVIFRLATARRERANPVTGIAAIILPPAAGALATMYHQLDSAWMILALSLSCTAAWATATSFRSWEKPALLAMLFIGLIAAWLTPFLWQSQPHLLWRNALFGS